MENINVNSNVNQSIKGQFVSREVVTCQSLAVEYILKTTYDSNENYENAPFNYDDIENQYIDNSEEIDELAIKIEELENTKEELEDKIIELEREEQGENLKEITELVEKSDKIRDEISTLEDKKDELEAEQEDPQEVYEWWEVSSYLCNKLKEYGEVVIDHMNLWGRCTTGQAILLDSIISQICYDMEILEGQEHSWADRI